MTSRDYEFVETPTLKNGKIHISQKPLNFIQKLVTNSSNEYETVLDLFSGSGTLAEACINTNRDFVIIEKNPIDFEKGKERVGKIFKNYGIDLQPLLNERM
jgi:site-specific DNA-methyltransferase (adenine-specific)